jgi:dimethylargininase
MRYLVRPPGPSFTKALSQHPDRSRIDATRAARQHAAFVISLRRSGAEVIELPAQPDMPDAPFVSDCIVTLRSPQGAIVVVTRPGAPSRRAEVGSVAEAARAAARHATFKNIEGPGTLEGGDVIILGQRIFIGVSERTNEDGAQQLAKIAAAAGYDARICPVEGRLHLASEATAIGQGTVVGTDAGLLSLKHAKPSSPDALEDVEQVVVPASEAPAANVIAFHGTCLVAAGFPITAGALHDLGAKVVEVELDEFTRADGGPTCLVAELP